MSSHFGVCGLSLFGRSLSSENRQKDHDELAERTVRLQTHRELLEEYVRLMQEANRAREREQAIAFDQSGLRLRVSAGWYSGQVKKVVQGVQIL